MRTCHKKGGRGPESVYTLCQMCRAVWLGRTWLVLMQSVEGSSTAIDSSTANFLKNCIKLS